MLRSVRRLERYRVNATDGDLGSVHDFLIDDEAWTIRYLVVDTGGFIGGRRVLISPISFRHVDWSTRRFHLALTTDAIMASPSVDVDRPVSRQHELQLHRYYGHGLYWSSPGLWGAGAIPSALAAGRPYDGAAPAPETGEEDVHLRSVNAIRNYHIQGTDGAIGHVYDLVINDETWEVRYLVINTSNWWVGEKVLVAPQWATHISWAEGNAYVSLSRDQIKCSPAWDGKADISRAYEGGLYAHYGRSSYWERSGRPEEGRQRSEGRVT